MNPQLDPNPSYCYTEETKLEPTATDGEGWDAAAPRRQRAAGDRHWLHLDLRVAKITRCPSGEQDGGQPLPISPSQSAPSNQPPWRCEFPAAGVNGSNPSERRACGLMGMAMLWLQGSEQQGRGAGMRVHDLKGGKS